jgi:hypothetical protein
LKFRFLIEAAQENYVVDISKGNSESRRNGNLCTKAASNYVAELQRPTLGLTERRGVGEGRRGIQAFTQKKISSFLLLSSVL